MLGLEMNIKANNDTTTQVKFLNKTAFTVPLDSEWSS